MSKYKKRGRPVVIEMDKVHPDWHQFILKADAVYPPGWSNGFTPWEILALPYKHAIISSLEFEVKALKEALETAKEAQKKAEKSAIWYRKQLILESRLGAFFTRITE